MIRIIGVRVRLKEDQITKLPQFNTICRIKTKHDTYQKPSVVFVLLETHISSTFRLAFKLDLCSRKNRLTEPVLGEHTKTQPAHTHPHTPV